MNLPSSPFPYSPLPGPAVRWPRPQDEQGSDGGRRGLGILQIPQLSRTIEIAHHATAIARSWDSVDSQRLWIWSRFLGDRNPIAGAVLSHPLDKDLGDARHPLVWVADNIETFGAPMRCGIGKALYAHAATFGYKISPSAEPSGRPDGDDGDHLWAALHPDYEDADLPMATARRDDALLNDLYMQFGPREGRPLLSALQPADIRRWGLPNYGAVDI